MKKIIIFGATGSTGVYLTDYLCEKLKDKYEIIAVGRRKTDYFDRFGIKYYSVDVCSKEEYKQIPTDDVYAAVILSGRGLC